MPIYHGKLLCLLRTLLRRRLARKTLSTVSSSLYPDDPAMIVIEAQYYGFSTMRELPIESVIDDDTWHKAQSRFRNRRVGQDRKQRYQASAFVS